MAQTCVIKCNLCDVNTALYFCRECVSALCSQCRTTHDKLLKNHSVTDAKGIDRTAFTSATQCNIHKQHYILYCKQCDILICSKCVSGDHNGHMTAETDVVVEDLRKIVTTKAAEVKSKEKGVLRKLDEKIEVQQTLTKDAQKFISDMKTTTEEIIYIIKSRQCNKVSEVEDSKEQRIRALDRDTTKLKKICMDHTAVHERLNKLLTETHGISFLHSFHILMKEIKDLDDAMIDDNFEMEPFPKYNIKTFLEELLGQLTSTFQLSLHNIDLKPIFLKKGDKLEHEMKESQQGIDSNKESWAAYTKSVTDISNGNCMGCGVYGSDGITYHKTEKMPNFSQTQLQHVLEGIKHNNPIPLTSVELGDMKFIYIRELGDGRNVHVFKELIDNVSKSIELGRCMLYLQSSNKVTIAALSESYTILGQAGLNRMNDIIQFLKTSVW